MKRADVKAQSDYLREEKLDIIDRWQRMYEKILDEKQCISLKTLAIKGQDMIDLGYKPGPELGANLNALLELVLDNPECNTREYLLQELSNLNS